VNANGILNVMQIRTNPVCHKRARAGDEATEQFAIQSVEGVKRASDNSAKTATKKAVKKAAKKAAQKQEATHVVSGAKQPKQSKMFKKSQNGKSE